MKRQTWRCHRPNATGRCGSIYFERRGGEGSFWETAAYGTTGSGPDVLFAFRPRSYAVL
jgi:hypothetical protein